ncbi:hypothetical protein K435DRAFT_864492 [Dendrothele bispora CBS 962.96]|uniref:Uncharacterized protein n=1 Tax=Dendrothele bispora (strain CBS 962.96) TaxID=1314807 RepID=A0A4S8LLW5_DENBC|nr:hypothetical protein K435DRAFT_864492 [Dendrothele bispora CBS 962.96]
MSTRTTALVDMGSLKEYKVNDFKDTYFPQINSLNHRVSSFTPGWIAAMTANVTFILDSNDLLQSSTTVNYPLNSPIEGNSANFSQMTDGNFYQDSLLFFNWTNEAEFQVGFDGSSILFFGYALGELASKNFTVDGSLVQPNTLSQDFNNSELPLTGGQFPSSPFQGHISGVQQMSIDYALVTATNTSNLEDKTIFVDDDDAEITWSGWTRQAGSCVIWGVKYSINGTRDTGGVDGSRVRALPHGNSVHQSNTLGDSFVFKFAGKSILVGGFTPGPDQGPLNGQGPKGVLTMTFDVDGNSTPKSYFTSATVFSESLHFVYFSNPDLPAGNHTLIVTIHSLSGNISAYIDYITYKPIFYTLIDKPDFSEPKPTPIPSPNPDPNQSGSHDSVAVKVGATIGSLLLITILVASLWFFKRRQKGEQRLQGIHEVMSGYVVEPFTMPISETNLHLALGRKGTGENLRSIITTQDVLTPDRPVSVALAMQPSDSAFNIIPPSSAMPISESPAAMAERMRGMEAQIALLVSREMQQHIVAPPTYQSEWDS